MERLIVCGREDLGEEYLCALVDPAKHAHAGEVSPIVRVLAVLKYPRQRVISRPEAVTEISPARAGTLCRLPLIREASGDEISRYSGWEESAEDLRRKYLEETDDPEERAILTRHGEGIYRPRGSLKTYKQHEIDAAQKAWKGVESNGMESDVSV